MKQIPVTDVGIKAVEPMANAQGFKELKFKNRHGKQFHDADWIEGVDYDESEHKNENDDEEEDQAYEYAEDEEEELNEEEEIDQEEIDNLIADEREQVNPNLQQPDEQEQEDIVVRPMRKMAY